VGCEGPFLALCGLWASKHHGALHPVNKRLVRVVAMSLFTGAASPLCTLVLRSLPRKIAGVLKVLTCAHAHTHTHALIHTHTHARAGQVRHILTGHGAPVGSVAAHPLDTRLALSCGEVGVGRAAERLRRLRRGSFSKAPMSVLRLSHLSSPASPCLFMRARIALRSCLFVSWSGMYYFSAVSGAAGGGACRQSCMQ